METILGLLMGLGLSAACGFRIFVPFLLVSIATKLGHLSLAPSFAWLGGDAALITLAVATCVEIGAYYVPWLDHLLDTIATPLAVIAGTLLTASMIGDISPYFRWTLAAIAGGSVAGIIQGTTVLARGTSGLATGGLANPIVATAELAGSLLMTILSLIVPVIAVMLLIVVFIVVWRKISGRYTRPPRLG